ncbi:MAG: DUF512 domain-containing protein [Clostridia bacterium]
MKKETGVVKSVVPGSIAYEAQIKAGDSIVSINGEKINDIFDYKFLSANEDLLIEVTKKNGELWKISVEKEEYEDLGIEFREYLINDEKSCTNNCIFCFIDQLPKGMRKTLYYKDDDSRLSFLTGNYITLTNMSKADIDRVIGYKMSPINISVHTTNPELRKKMMKNRFAGDVMKKISLLDAGGVKLNCQIVLCRNINDKSELDRTISDLSKHYPNIQSISVVPVGTTRYREGLTPLNKFDRESSVEVIKQVTDWQEKLVEKLGTRLVYLADEFYIMAEHEMPKYEDYEDFPQIENGVGLIAMLMKEFREQFEILKKEDVKESLKRRRGNIEKRHVSIATGVSSYKYINEIAETLSNFFKITVSVYPIVNTFFGEEVTVTGLITGNDIINQLKKTDLGEELLISKSMLKADEDIFLDDISVIKLQKVLKTKAVIVENNGKDVIEKVLGKVI